MILELMSCRGCWRVIDQTNFIKCPNCGSRIFETIGPSKFNLIRWVITSPKHVFDLLIKDLWGKNE